MNAVMAVQGALLKAPKYVQPTLDVWGRKVALADFAELNCGCGSADGCPGLRLTDLHHLCIDIKNASGNLHKDIATGEFWIEFHLDACCSIFNHLQKGDWYRWGISDEQYRTLVAFQSLQQFSGADLSGMNWLAHLCVSLKSAYLEKVTNPQYVAEFASIRGLGIEEAKTRLYDLLAWLVGGMIYVRTTLSLNHELLDRSSFGSQSVRLWQGSELQLEKTLEAVKNNPVLKLPLMKDGAVHLLEPGSIPARRSFLGQPPLPVLRDPMQLLLQGEG